MRFLSPSTLVQLSATDRELLGMLTTIGVRTPARRSALTLRVWDQIHASVSPQVVEAENVPQFGSTAGRYQTLSLRGNQLASVDNHGD